MENLKDLLKPEIIWFLLGISMLILEFIMPGLIIFFFGVGACVVGVLCLIFDLSVNAQLLIFIFFSIISLIFLRKWLRDVFTGRTKASDAEDIDLAEFIGERAVVIEEISPKKFGKVEFHGSHWAAAAEVSIKKGTAVEVVGKDNITLKVKPL